MHYKYLFVKKNVFNYSELHFSEGTSFKIHTLNCSANPAHLPQNYSFYVKTIETLARAFLTLNILAMVG